MSNIFPIITKNMQDAFETQQRLLRIADHTPEICGIYGRACRQMDKPEGANRAICIGCPLEEYAVRKSQKESGL